MVASGFVTPERTHLIGSLSRFYAMDEKIAMGDGRFDQDKLIKTVKDNARDTLLIDMDALAKQSGSIINAVMLGAIAGSGRLPLTRRAVGSGDPRRRQVGRQQLARLPRRLRRRARESAAGQDARQKAQRPDHARSARARGLLFAARAGAGDRDRGHSAADRLPGRRLCAALSRPAARSGRCRCRRRHAGQAAQGGRAPARGAHVVRGRGAGGAGQDFARAHAAHRARGIARQGRAVLGARFPQARHRGIDPIAAAVPGAADSAAQRSARAGSAASISAWRSIPPRSPAICAS